MTRFLAGEARETRQVQQGISVSHRIVIMLSIAQYTGLEYQYHGNSFISGISSRDGQKDVTHKPSSPHDIWKIRSATKPSHTRAMSHTKSLKPRAGHKADHKATRQRPRLYKPHATRQAPLPQQATATSHKQQATNRKPQATSNKPQATSHKPRATSHEPLSLHRFVEKLSSSHTPGLSTNHLPDLSPFLQAISQTPDL